MCAFKKVGRFAKKLVFGGIGTRRVTDKGEISHTIVKGGTMPLQPKSERRHTAKASLSRAYPELSKHRGLFDQLVKINLKAHLNAPERLKARLTLLEETKRKTTDKQLASDIDVAVNKIEGLLGEWERNEPDKLSRRKP